MKSVFAAIAVAILATIVSLPVEAASVGKTPSGFTSPAPIVDQVHWRHRHHGHWRGHGWRYPRYYGYYYAPRHYWPYWRRGYRSHYWW